MIEPTEQDMLRAIDLIRARIEKFERHAGIRVRISSVRHELVGRKLRVIAITPSNFSYAAEIEISQRGESVSRE